LTGVSIGASWYPSYISSSNNRLLLDVNNYDGTIYFFMFYLAPLKFSLHVYYISILLFKSSAKYPSGCFCILLKSTVIFYLMWSPYALIESLVFGWSIGKSFLMALLLLLTSLFSFSYKVLF
jgi:hypothetical protein